MSNRAGRARRLPSSTSSNAVVYSSGMTSNVIGLIVLLIPVMARLVGFV